MLDVYDLNQDEIPYNLIYFSSFIEKELVVLLMMMWGLMFSDVRLTC